MEQILSESISPRTSMTKPDGQISSPALLVPRAGLGSTGETSGTRNDTWRASSVPDEFTLGVCGCEKPGHHSHDRVNDKKKKRFHA